MSNAEAHETNARKTTNAKTIFILLITFGSLVCWFVNIRVVETGEYSTLLYHDFSFCV